MIVPLIEVWSRKKRTGKQKLKKSDSCGKKCYQKFSKPLAIKRRQRRNPENWLQ